MSILLLLLKINTLKLHVDRSIRWLGNAKETANFDELLDGIDIGLISTFNVSQRYVPLPILEENDGPIFFHFWKLYSM